MGSSGCDGYGREWERNDPVCLDCPDEYLCRDRTLKRNGFVTVTKKKRPVSVDSSLGSKSNRGVYSYPTNTKYLLPEDGESAMSRVGKNMLAGGLSAIGGEVFAFFQEWRWPFLKLKSTKPRAPAPGPKSTQAEKPKPGPKPAKKIFVEDFDEDELDIDLDDL